MQKEPLIFLHRLLGGMWIKLISAKPTLDLASHCLWDVAWQTEIMD